MACPSNYFWGEVNMKHSLIPLYQRMHADYHFSGISIYAYADRIADVIVSSGVTTLSDYGSGKGRQYIEGRIHELWGGIMPTLYDPAVEEYAKHPVGKFGGVFAIDVLEHIPEDELHETLTDIRALADKWVFLSICSEPAKKCLPTPDSRNVHVTIREPAWWLSAINDIFAGGPEAHIYFDRGEQAKVKPSTARKLPRDERVRLGWAKPRLRSR
jgi:hypothetical protein